jgi:hypothetical protein
MNPGSDTPKPPKVIPPIYFFALLLVGIGLGKYLPAFQIVPAPFRHAGTAAIVIGIFLRFWAFFLVRGHKTTIKPHGLAA